MLGFVISTLAFFIAAYLLNRYLAFQGIEKGTAHNMLVMVLATVVSMGTGWLVDKLDGDADKPQTSMAEVVHSGDPLLITKKLIGIN